MSFCVLVVLICTQLLTLQEPTATDENGPRSFSPESGNAWGAPWFQPFPAIDQVANSSRSYGDNATGPSIPAASIPEASIPSVYVQSAPSPPPVRLLGDANMSASSHIETAMSSSVLVPALPFPTQDPPANYPQTNPFGLASFQEWGPPGNNLGENYGDNFPFPSEPPPKLETMPSNGLFSERARMPGIQNFFRRRMGSDLGLGYERVMFAPMVLDTAISSPNMGIRIRSDRSIAAPDRLEYLWAKAGRGPAPETSLNVLDTIFRAEVGNAQAVAITELKLRAVDPDINANTVGFGDMVVGGKATLFDGRCTKVASQFLTYLKTGPADRGLGTGHVSLEPGLLVRHQWSEATYLHGECKYWLPLGGSPGFAGDLLQTGLGASTVWRETDHYALMPTFEMQTHSFLFGSRTLPSGVAQRVNGKTALDIFPGCRLALARSSLGIWEAGFAGGFTVADRDWFDSRLIFDLRLVR